MKVSRKLPENLKEEHLQYFVPQLEILIPDAGFTLLKRNVLIAYNGIVISKFSVLKQSLLYDKRLAEPGRRLLLAKTLVKALLCGDFSILGGRNVFVTIINEWSENYFHWFTEALPKLMVILKAGYHPVVLLPEHYSSGFHIESLEILGIRYKKFKGKFLIGKNVLLPDRTAPFSAHYHPEIMEDLAKRLKINLQAECCRGKRIYITRRKAAKRRIENEEEVVCVLQAFGFFIIELETLLLEEQISTMHHAEIIVSIHGAGLTNMIFCKPETIIFEFSLRNEYMDKCFFNLANSLRLKYYYQFCQSADAKADYHSSDLIVDVQELQDNLFKIIK